MNKILEAPIESYRSFTDMTTAICEKFEDCAECPFDKEGKFICLRTIYNTANYYFYEGIQKDLVEVQKARDTIIETLNEHRIDVKIDIKGGVLLMAREEEKE